MTVKLEWIFKDVFYNVFCFGVRTSWLLDAETLVCVFSLKNKFPLHFFCANLIFEVFLIFCELVKLSLLLVLQALFIQEV